VVTASMGNTAQIWDARTGKALAAPLQHQDSVWSAQFSPDGSRVVTASADNTAQIWDARTGKALGAPLQHQDSVWSAQFSPDGSRVVTASADNTAQIWDARGDLGWASLAENLPESERWRTKLSEALQALWGHKVADNGRIVPLEREQILAWRKQALDSPISTDFERVMHWHLADRATRTISPFSEITVPVFIEREIAWVLAHPADQDRNLSILAGAYNLDPSHPLILLAMSVAEDHPETKALWKRLSFPRFEKDARLAARAAEILLQGEDRANARKAATIARALPSATPEDKAKAQSVLDRINSPASTSSSSE